MGVTGLKRMSPYSDDTINDCNIDNAMTRLFLVLVLVLVSLIFSCRFLSFYLISHLSLISVLAALAIMNAAKYDHHKKLLKTFGNLLNTKYKLTVIETVFLGSFLINFFVGKIIHFTSQHEEVYNYYNDKNNILNQLFVKKGWLWTTVVISMLYIGAYISNHPHVSSINTGKVAIRAIVNYAISTIWWWLFTQKCFGLPLMDKIFLWTGGKCVNVQAENLGSHAQFFTQVADVYESNSVGSVACRRVRGSWEGGHDPSGHVFLMVHLSLYLFFEMMQFIDGDVLTKWKSFYSKFKAKPSISSLGLFVLNHPYLPALWLVGLWWFMLLMTNIYFHTILEKLVGLGFGYLISLVYLVPRWRVKEKKL